MSCPRQLFLTQRKSVFRDVRMQSCLAHRFLVTLHLPLYGIFAFLSNNRPRLACMGTSRKTDFRSSKNNFRGHDMDRQPPSLSPHFLLGKVNCTSKPSGRKIVVKFSHGKWSQFSSGGFIKTAKHKLISFRSSPWWMITKPNKDIANRKHTYLFSVW